MELKELVELIHTYDMDDKRRNLKVFLASLSDASSKTSSSSVSTSPEISLLLCKEKIEFYKRHYDELKLEVANSRSLKFDFIEKKNFIKTKLRS